MWMPVFRTCSGVPKIRGRLSPDRLLAAAALLAGAALLGGCALNGDFGRVRPSLVHDDMHDWVGRDAVRGIGGRPSEFRLTDNERELRDRAYALIAPPYDRHHWDAVFAEYGFEGPRPGAPFDVTAYWRRLYVNDRRSESSSYAQLVTDARNDVVRLEPFFATAARVVDMDRRRMQSLAYVVAGSGLSEAEDESVRSRVNENTAVIEWVCASLVERAQSYRFALERLVISIPAVSAAEVERSLTLLQSRTDAYCARGQAVVAKG
jgi:hypothetical protein